MNCIRYSGLVTKYHQISQNVDTSDLHWHFQWSFEDCVDTISQTFQDWISQDWMSLLGHLSCSWTSLCLFSFSKMSVNFVQYRGQWESFNNRHFAARELKYCNFSLRSPCPKNTFAHFFLCYSGFLFMYF